MIVQLENMDIEAKTTFFIATAGPAAALVPIIVLLHVSEIISTLFGTMEQSPELTFFRLLSVLLQL